MYRRWTTRFWQIGDVLEATKVKLYLAPAYIVISVTSHVLISVRRTWLSVWEKELLFTPANTNRKGSSPAEETPMI